MLWITSAAIIFIISFGLMLLRQSLLSHQHAADGPSVPVENFSFSEEDEDGFDDFEEIPDTDAVRKRTFKSTKEATVALDAALANISRDVTIPESKKNRDPNVTLSVALGSISRETQAQYQKSSTPDSALIKIDASLERIPLQSKAS